MKEWRSPYNGFNSMGVLVYSKQLEAVAKQDFLPPVMVDIDPSNLCNFNCIFCNALDYRSIGKNMISKDQLIRIADFSMMWGVKSACVAGGGEPLTNPHFNDLLHRLFSNKIEIGVITNGSLLNKESTEMIVKTCRWCGISVDAATYETFNNLKGLKIKTDFMFSSVLSNIEKLVSECSKTKCEVSYKYLLHPINQYEILDAFKLAQKIGVRDFHLRPVGWENHKAVEGKPQLQFDIDEINKQIDECQSIETEKCRFFGVRHKFNPDFTRKVSFSRCWAIPLLVTFGADGNYHTCFDMRGNKDLILCSHDPNPAEILKIWNTEKHKNLLKSIDVSKCPRCTFVTYNEVVEKCFIDDQLCRNFI